MNDIVKVSWSGGKDSTAAVHLYLLRGDKVKAVCYIPYLTEQIPLILKNHFEFINNTAELFRAMGADVHLVKGMTYVDFVKRGSKKCGVKGFPHIAHCNFKNYSKIPALNACDIGYYDYQDIGIAIDECHRNKLFAWKYGIYQFDMFSPPPKDDGKIRSILCELGMTEQDAKEYCLSKGILSPHYAENRRDGCALCPNAKKEGRERYFSEYPEAIGVIKDLQEFVKQNSLIEKFPLRDHKFFIEEDGTIN